jgi:transcriptional regulator with XRE-family HTH domain
MSTDEKGAIGPDALTGEYVAIDYKALGSKIRHVRGTATQADFAKQFGITRAEVSKIERGEGRPTAELLYNICLRHHLSLEWMLSGHEPSPESGQEELFKEEPAKAATIKEGQPAVCATPILELTDMVEWFRLHPEDLVLVNKMIQGKKLMLASMKELEKYQGTSESEEKG